MLDSHRSNSATEIRNGGTTLTRGIGGRIGNRNPRLQMLSEIQFELLGRVDLHNTINVDSVVAGGVSINATSVQ